MRKRENAPAGVAKAMLAAGASANTSAIAQTRAALRRPTLFSRTSISASCSGPMIDHNMAFQGRLGKPRLRQLVMTSGPEASRL